MIARTVVTAFALVALVALIGAAAPGSNPPGRAGRVPPPAKPKVLVYYDMEGISGITGARQVLVGQPEYPRSRELLTGDVNAAIAGLVAGGAGEIVVTDAHGSGNDEEQDILLAKLDKRATFMFKDHPFDPYMESPDSSFQAIICIGMHARAGTPGFMAHTVTVEPAYRVNGAWLTETSIVARSAARYGIPVIMVSGDDVLQGQIKEEFPSAEYGLVKHADGRAHAKPLPLATARENIRRAAQAAIEKLGSMKPLPVEPSYRFEVSYLNKLEADLAASVPGIERLDSVTFGYTTPDFPTGFVRSGAMTSLASMERLRLLSAAVREAPGGEKIRSRYLSLVLLNWLEPEKMPKPAAAPARAKKRYYGDS
jgi:D-amino peptidase